MGVQKAKTIGEEDEKADAKPEVKAGEKAQKKVEKSKGKAASAYAIKQTKKKKKIFRKITRGKAYIKSTYNNTIVTVTDLNGSVLAWASAGNAGFKGAKKATPFAAGIVAKNVVESIAPYGIKELDVFLKGIGVGREAAVRGLQNSGIEILSMKDVTPIPHNGCRPRKERRV